MKRGDVLSLLFCSEGFLLIDESPVVRVSVCLVPAVHSGLLKLLLLQNTDSLCLCVCLLNISTIQFCSSIRKHLLLNFEGLNVKSEAYSVFHIFRGDFMVLATHLGSSFMKK